MVHGCCLTKPKWDRVDLEITELAAQSSLKILHPAGQAGLHFAQVMPATHTKYGYIALVVLGRVIFFPQVVIRVKWFGLDIAAAAIRTAPRHFRFVRVG